MVHSIEGGLGPLRERFDGNQMVVTSLFLEGRNNNLLVATSLLLLGALGKSAVHSGHLVVALRRGTLGFMLSGRSNVRERLYRTSRQSMVSQQKARNMRNEREGQIKNEMKNKMNHTKNVHEKRMSQSNAAS